MSGNKSSLICQCAARGLVEVGTVRSDGAVVVSDLCEAAKERDPILASPFAEIHACHPRAVRALFAFAGYPVGDARLIDHRIPSSAQSMDPEVRFDSAWYPVIDYDRCTGCGQCHDFCLFGVFEKTDEGGVVVARPESCKNNCPACARVCPETAIIFPKVGESPINGAEITDEDDRKANVKINVDEILGDDVYAALNARKEKRRSLLNQNKLRKALEERRACSEGEA